MVLLVKILCIIFSHGNPRKKILKATWMRSNLGLEIWRINKPVWMPINYKSKWKSFSL